MLVLKESCGKAKDFSMGRNTCQHPKQIFASLEGFLSHHRMQYAITAPVQTQLTVML